VNTIEIVKVYDNSFVSTLTITIQNNCKKVSVITAEITVRVVSASRTGIFKKSMGARDRGGIVLSYRPARLQAGGILTLESIPGPHKHLKRRALTF
jgi:hypothetical protein